MSWMMSEKHSNKAGSAQKSFVIKWKWFLQEQAGGGMQRGPRHTHEQVAYFPPGPTLEPHP